MSILVSEEELDKLKQAARLEAYTSYSEFVRRTALKESDRVIKKMKEKIHLRSIPVRAQMTGLQKKSTNHRMKLLTSKLNNRIQEVPSYVL